MKNTLPLGILTEPYDYYNENEKERLRGEILNGHLAIDLRNPQEEIPENLLLAIEKTLAYIQDIGRDIKNSDNLSAVSSIVVEMEDAIADARQRREGQSAKIHELDWNTSELETNPGFTPLKK